MRGLKRPILRYFGGKWKLAPWVIEHFPQHTMYVEPFGGAASVLLRKQRALNEVYNDLDNNVVNIFRVLQDETLAAELIRRCYLTPFSRVEFEQSFELTEDPVEQALRFIIRSFFGYGSKACKSSATMSGFRSRRKSDASPAVDWRNYPHFIPKIVERMRGVVIENKPAEDILERYDSDDSLFYVDPPYVHSTRNTTSGGTYAHEMDDTEHAKLSGQLHSRKGMTILSGYDCDLYRQLYPDWKMVTRVHRAEQAKVRTECLWICPKAQEKLKGKQCTLFPNLAA